MIEEIIKINWLLLLAPFLSALGFAAFIFILSAMEYFKISSALKRVDFFKGKFFKYGAWISVGLIIAGIILFQFKIPSNKLIVVKVVEEKKDTAIHWPLNNTEFSFLPSDLTIDAHNKSHKMNNEDMIDNTISLFWDGFIQTPFIMFDKGAYMVEFQAKGTKAEDEYSKIKVEFESPDKNNYLVAKTILYFEMTKKMEPYRMQFEIRDTTIGRIRITYFNDLFVPETGKGRDVWIKGFNIIKQ
jgi:hypothetical protein